ncbi:MAG: hypothetical protein JOZ99_07445 [Actinobacteria bacterium]|nr:hypothetical protein [Actinomycetota bacterium]
MFVLADLAASPPTLTLEEPADCSRFHVRAHGPHEPALLAAALAQQGTGRMDGDDAFIAADAVRMMAKGRVDDEWYADFAGMLEYAGSKGWLDHGGGAIRAHVEWQSPA